MGTLYLVRHGQASFGAADYDQLSPLGHKQCHALGQYLAARGQRFEAVLTGTLKRHAQSLAALVDGYEGPGDLPAARALPGLDEYDSGALVQAIHPEPLPRANTPELYRAHFRLLRQALARWMAGDITPAGMPSYTAFVAGINEALEQVRTGHEGDVLIVSSGGPISTAVGQVLGTAAATTIELNLRIRNSALTEFAFTPKRHMLVSYNHLPHLDHPDRRDWVTYS